MNSIKIQFGQAAIIPAIVEATKEAQDPLSVKRDLAQGFSQNAEGRALEGNLEL
ncbi:hypothetical protein N9Z27_01980 [Alphaproteobacteria bacterium]|nr:hypothetical protein [Alphaproteobacteria bacterium]